MGTVFSIQEFSIYDGLGIRTSVFLKGCPLRCMWCHSPEGQSPAPEIIRSPNGCANCGRCEKAADRDGTAIRYTDESIAACPRHLLRLCGREYTPEQVFDEVMRSKELLDGVTFSGGEPFMQADFLLRCLSRFYGKLHTAVQTCGYADPYAFEQALSVCDYFLFDLKLMDEQAHIRYTGIGNKLIHRNFERLAKSGVPFTVRVPLIPGVTDTATNLEEIALFLETHAVSSAELLPYNKMAGGKYKSVGREYIPSFDETKPAEPRPELFAKHGISVKVL